MREVRDLSYPGTYAVTVTYGERHAFVREDVQYALANGVGGVIVVDNGSSPVARRAIRDIESESGGRVSIVALPQNRGSAGGYKAGMEAAMNRSDCDYLWLLDDDNRPADGALTALMRQHQTLSQAIAIDRLAVTSLRSAWEEHKQVARGCPVKDVFPRYSSFMGFHFLRPPRFFQRKPSLNGVDRKQQKLPPAVKIPFGPYGGLFIHKSVLRKLGYPNERFYLYNDDTEYTSRLTRVGGQLFLVPSSVVNDLDRSWHVLNEGETLFSHLLLANSDLRIYYVTRNQSYLENYVWVKNRLLYGVNKSIFFLFLAIYAAVHRKWRRLALMVRATREGKQGKLNTAPAPVVRSCL